MVITEVRPAGMAVFLLVWIMLNCLWLILLRRPTVAAFISLEILIAMTGRDRFCVIAPHARVGQPSNADHPQRCKRNSDDVAFVDWTVRRISRLLDDGLIEIEFAYHGGVATNRSQSRWNTSVAAWKINPSLLR